MLLTKIISNPLEEYRKSYIEGGMTISSKSSKEDNNIEQYKSLTKLSIADETSSSVKPKRSKETILSISPYNNSTMSKLNYSLLVTHLCIQSKIQHIQGVEKSKTNYKRRQQP
jgi:hypothetical protein